MELKEVKLEQSEASLLRPAQVAEMLQVPLQTLYAWRTRGVGPRGLRVGRHLRYRRSDVLDWIDKQALQDG